jgi:hypothetical protein
MTVIDAVAHARYGDLANNFLKCLDFIKNNIEIVRYTDPANTNNIISELCTAPEKRIAAIQAKNSRTQSKWENIVW